MLFISRGRFASSLHATYYPMHIVLCLLPQQHTHPDEPTVQHCVMEHLQCVKNINKDMWAVNIFEWASYKPLSLMFLVRALQTWMLWDEFNNLDVIWKGFKDIYVFTKDFLSLQYKYTFKTYQKQKSVHRSSGQHSEWNLNLTWPAFNVLFWLLCSRCRRQRKLQ